MIQLKCPAKINLFLAIRGKDASGYHEIETVFARLPQLADELTLTPAQALTVTFEPAYDIDPENNSITKAVRLLEEQTKRSLPYAIHVRKNIPPQSGLGGGASNAASTLLALNQIENLKLTREELMELGAQVGMDVPFFIAETETALGTHYGERITPLQPLPKNLSFVIEPQKNTMSSASAYALWDEKARKPAPPIKAFLAHLQNGYTPGILSTLHNDFEALYPEDTTVLTEPFQRRLLAGSGAAYVVAHVVDN